MEQLQTIDPRLLLKKKHEQDTPWPGSLSDSTRTAVTDFNADKHARSTVTPNGTNSVDEIQHQEGPQDGDEYVLSYPASSAASQAVLSSDSNTQVRQWMPMPGGALPPVDIHPASSFSDAILPPNLPVHDYQLASAVDFTISGHDSYFEDISLLAPTDEFSLPTSYIQDSCSALTTYQVPPPMSLSLYSGWNQHPWAGIPIASTGCVNPETFDVGYMYDVRRHSEPCAAVLPPVPSSRLMEDTVSISAINPTSYKTKQRRHSDKLALRPTLPREDISVTFEPGDGRQLNHGKISKGRRRGPLLLETRRNAKICRQQQTKCIRCRKDKAMCDATSDGPCSYCRSLGLTKTWTQPCVKACFLSIVESGTCNYISQRAINHMRIDATSRMRIELPETLDLDGLLSNVLHRQASFNIRVRQESGSLFVLKLDACYRYLIRLRSAQTESKQNLRRFIDRDILRSEAWHACVSDCDPAGNIMGCLLTWSNMPSRASYSYIPRNHDVSAAESFERDMDVDDYDQKLDIIIAAQLARIVCRKLEVDAYAHIQTTLNKWTSLSGHELSQTVHELGQLLLTLRWRVSWWTLLGDGGTAPDPVGKQAFEDRVNELCRTLYFYYCMLRRRMPTWSNKNHLNGVESKYADTSFAIFDDFPGAESKEGFESWMARGKELIGQAGVMKKSTAMGPPAPEMISVSA